MSQKEVVVDLYFIWQLGIQSVINVIWFPRASVTAIKLRKTSEESNTSEVNFQ
jgi:hypothetical protein